MRRLTLEGDAVICVVGPAGTGKSRTMGAAAWVWHAGGIPVRGLAVSAVAAGVLQSESGIASDRIAKLLYEHARPEGPEGPQGRWRLRRGEVVVVDEAGMVATRDLARLIELSAEAGAKPVLVGDHAQLGAVEAGGLFRLLAGTHSVQLSEVRRSSADWERAASLRLRARDPGVLSLYETHGRISGGHRLQVLDAAFAAWRDARTREQSVVVCASDHGTVAELSRRNRTALIATGRVEAHGVAAGEHLVGWGTRSSPRGTSAASPPPVGGGYETGNGGGPPSDTGTVADRDPPGGTRLHHAPRAVRG